MCSIQVSMRCQYTCVGGVRKFSLASMLIYKIPYSYTHIVGTRLPQQVQKDFQRNSHRLLLIVPSCLAQGSAPPCLHNYYSICNMHVCKGDMSL